jgi:hypothetical protein
MRDQSSAVRLSDGGARCRQDHTDRLRQTARKYYSGGTMNDRSTTTGAASNSPERGPCPGRPGPRTDRSMGRRHRRARIVERRHRPRRLTVEMRFDLGVMGYDVTALGMS